MIHLHYGDIFDVYADFYVNFVDISGISDAGIALRFANKYPKETLHYQEICKSKNLALGSIKLVKVDKRTDWICYCAVRLNKKYNFDIKHFKSCIRELKKEIFIKQPDTVVIPKIEYKNTEIWEDLFGIIREELGASDSTIICALGNMKE